ncbi:MAG: hypothetical protein ACRYGR_00810 [Janthinobacterium lividum]
MNSTNSLKMYIIFYMLFSFIFNFSNASIEYIDKESDDLTNLSKKFDLETIQNYTEDLSLEACERVKNFKEQIADYSIKDDLIPHVVKTVASEALMASVKIMTTCPDKSTILYLGRSPSILLTTSNFLESNIKIGKKLNHVQINFSGTPNISNVRNREVNDQRNVVTLERLNHFYSYLDSGGLGNLTPNSQLYIVDQIGKGAGMNAFLRILRQYYVSYKDLENTPKVTLLLMNFNNKPELRLRIQIKDAF